MSTKTGLKKTFSWRFGPSKFSRKNKTHSEVWTFICVLDAFLLLLLLYFYSKALHCSEQQKQTSFDPVIFTIQFVSTNKRGCCFSHILTRLVSVFGSFSQHLIIINSITHFFWVFCCSFLSLIGCCCCCCCLFFFLCELYVHSHGDVFGREIGPILSWPIKRRKKRTITLWFSVWVSFLPCMVAIGGFRSFYGHAAATSAWCWRMYPKFNDSKVSSSLDVHSSLNLAHLFYFIPIIIEKKARATYQ